MADGRQFGSPKVLQFGDKAAGNQAGGSMQCAECEAMLAETLGGEGGRTREFRRDAWARPWPAGPEMLCYMISHEAHHRGQVCMLAHQLGFPLPGKVTSALWNWEKLWKD